MSKSLIEDKVYEKLNFKEQELEKGDYENCTFVNCIFAGANISGINFASCTFKNCDMTMVKLGKTAMRNVSFKSCKLMGLPFDNCNEFLFSVDFEDCILNLSSFYKVNLKKTKFRNCKLHEADFSRADLNGAVFDNCDLMGTMFDNTVLESADLRSAYNYSIDPEKNRIKKAKFSLRGIAGLLDKYAIEIEY